MDIVVGQGYGSRRSNRGEPAFNQLVCDELGLVAELEFRAGLSHKPVSRAERVVIYLKALKAADTPERFYHQSLSVDEVACARELLAWRDEAILHGWRVPQAIIKRFGDGEALASVGRLQDLEAVESLLSDFPLSLEERVLRLFDYLEPVCRSIHFLEIHGSAASWPKLYRRLFEEIHRYRQVYADKQFTMGQTQKESPIHSLVTYHTEWLLPDWPYTKSQEDGQYYQQKCCFLNLN